jgi:hypothetical protein
MLAGKFTYLTRKEIFSLFVSEIDEGFEVVREWKGK